jgi:hypothetical protein
MLHRRPIFTALFTIALVAMTALPAAARPATRLISLPANGDPANGDSNDATLSDSGRYVAYDSDANNLSNRDDNSYTNVFVHDRGTGRNHLVSVRSNGGAANGSSADAQISGNGRYVCFQSDAPNLSNGDSDLYRDVFVHDRRTGQTRVVSIASNGDEAEQGSEDCSISDSGRYVAFQSQSDNFFPGSGDDAYMNVFVHDLETGRTRLMSKTSGGDPGDDYSESASISGNGMRVAFESGADNLASGNTIIGIFVHDRRTGSTRLVSRATNGDPADDESYDPAMSDARFVAFESYAHNLSAADDNNDLDVYVRDLETGKTRLASKRSDGTVADGFSTNPGLSGNGRFVVFRSDAANLSDRDDDTYGNDIFVHDRKTRRTRLVSIRTDGDPADGESNNPEASGHRTVSETGAWVVFDSDADNLSNRDHDDYTDVFVRGRLA